MNQATLLFSPMHYSWNKKCKCIWCDSCEILWRKIGKLFFPYLPEPTANSPCGQGKCLVLYLYSCSAFKSQYWPWGKDVSLFRDTEKKKGTVWTTALKPINIVWTLKLCNFFKVACLSAMPKFFTVENLAMYFVTLEIPNLHREKIELL